MCGAQRSGTNIAAAITAHENDLPLFNERDLGYSSCAITPDEHSVLLDFMNSTDEFVLQCPSLNVFLPTLNERLTKPVFIIWVFRSFNEVRQSRQRVNWSGEEKELKKFKRYWKHIAAKCVDTVAMANILYYDAVRYATPSKVVDYSSLKNSKLWKTERSALKIGET